MSDPVKHFDFEPSLHHHTRGCTERQSIQDPNVFKHATRVHDWRNHVPQFIKDSWSIMTVRERLIVAAMAEQQADREEWD